MLVFFQLSLFLWWQSWLWEMVCLCVGGIFLTVWVIPLVTQHDPNHTLHESTPVCNWQENDSIMIQSHSLNSFLKSQFKFSPDEPAWCTSSWYILPKIHNADHNEKNAKECHYVSSHLFWNIKNNKMKNCSVWVLFRIFYSPWVDFLLTLTVFFFVKATFKTFYNAFIIYFCYFSNFSNPNPKPRLSVLNNENPLYILWCEQKTTCWGWKTLSTSKTK